MKTRRHNLKQRLVSEAIGTSFLVAAVVGSGIMGERLAGGNGAVALLVNTIATGAALVALICTFGPISGAHLNPAVSLADAIEGGITLPEMLAYIAAQCTGGIGGTIAAHLMFDLPWYSPSTHARNGSALLFSEFVASFGLLCVIWGCSRLRSGVVPFAVASYIPPAYWFTSSTSFANPAVTLARSLTNTFTGIRPMDVPLFVVAQVAGALRLRSCFVGSLRTFPQPPVRCWFHIQTRKVRAYEDCSLRLRAQRRTLANSRRVVQRALRPKSGASDFGRHPAC